MSGRIVIAEDHHVVRTGLKLLLQSRGYGVVGEAANGDVAIHLVQELQPDLLLLDLAMPGGPDGLQVTAQLRQSGFSTPIVVISMYDEDALKEAALKAGANAFVLKQAPETELLEVIAGCLPSQASPTLTARENEILRWLAEGYGNKDIAIRLSISVKTVETHRAHLFLKLGLQSRADLVRYAVSQGFFQPG
ncbi:MAG: response regulator transcription factor [Candidatus Eremiobacteraeota bacterium]|nr:response regulator transcription factor [Candidatus Eremiobacteraeota bacterium]MCW5872524.1 response regulator transcription factor [Candidatus Eremiobacteraeota bacterium]